MVVSMLKAKSEACPPGTAASQQGPRIGSIPAAVLAKEAVYNAAGVGAYGLHDYIDFKQWLQTTLLQVCVGDGCMLPPYPMPCSDMHGDYPTHCAYLLPGHAQFLRQGMQADAASTVLGGE